MSDKGKQHTNAALIRRMHQALGEGYYVPALTEMFAPDVVWHLPGKGPLAGDHVGRDAVFATMRRCEELNGGTLRVEVRDILANDEHAVALLRARATRRGRSYDSLEVDVYHIREGKVTEFWSFAEDQRVTDEFLS